MYMYNIYILRLSHPLSFAKFSDITPAFDIYRLQNRRQNKKKKTKKTAASPTFF